MGNKSYIEKMLKTSERINILGRVLSVLIVISSIFILVISIISRSIIGSIYFLLGLFIAIMIWNIFAVRVNFYKTIAYIAYSLGETSKTINHTIGSVNKTNVNKSSEKEQTNVKSNPLEYNSDNSLPKI